MGLTYKYVDSGALDSLHRTLPQVMQAGINPFLSADFGPGFSRRGNDAEVLIYNQSRLFFS